MLTLHQIDALLRDREAAPATDRGHVLAEIRDAIRAHAETLRRLHDEARRALNHVHCDGHSCPRVGACDDLRPALAKLIRGFAAVHGRTAAEQIAAFAAEGDETFSTMAVLAWGLDPCA